MRTRTWIDGIAGPLGRGRSGSAGAALADARRFEAARTILSVFYAALLFLTASDLGSWQGYLASHPEMPRWPVFWLRFLDPATGIGLLLAFHLLAGLLGVLFADLRVVRVLVFLAWLQFVAFKFSFGSINHGDHLAVLISFVLILLPAGWRSLPAPPRRVRAATLLVFSGCQSLLLLTYSMAGSWKIISTVTQAFRGEVHYLSLQGLAQQIAAKMLSDDSRSVLGPAVIAHPAVGWPLIVGALYLEAFALFVVARPSLHRAWGMGLILLHLSSQLTMGVGFPQNVLWLTLFLVLSPFSPAELTWRESLRDLPGVGRWLPL